MYLQSYSFFFLRAIIIYKEKKGLLAAGKVDCFVRKVVQMASKSARDYTAKWHQKVISRCLLGACLLMMDVASMGD